MSPYVKQRAYDDLAWAAGFFDGEGCTTLGRHRDKPVAFTIQVKQVDIRPLLRFQRAVGDVGRIYIEKRKDRADIHNWRAQGRDAMTAMGLLWPWLSEPKQEQYNARLAEWRMSRNNWVDGQLALKEEAHAIRDSA